MADTSSLERTDHAAGRSRGSLQPPSSDAAPLDAHVHPDASAEFEASQEHETSADDASETGSAYLLHVNIDPS